jgi:hypothetical protein
MRISITFAAAHNLSNLLEYGVVEKRREIQALVFIDALDLC